MTWIDEEGGEEGRDFADAKRYISQYTDGIGEIISYLRDLECSSPAIYEKLIGSEEYSALRDSLSGLVNALDEAED